MTTATTPAADKARRRIEALLAKAASTTYGPEAEAALAKAAELMEAHGIDAAGLRTADTGAVAQRTITVPGPYRRVRVVFLSSLAELNGCAAIVLDGPDGRDSRMTLFGRAANIDRAQAMFDLLNPQLAAAMNANVFGTSKAYRRAAGLGFVNAVIKRLQALQVVVDQEDAGGSLLPAVRSDRRDADALLRDAYPRTRMSRTTTSNLEGYAAGRQAGGRAQLGARSFGAGRAALSR